MPVVLTPYVKSVLPVIVSEANLVVPPKIPLTNKMPLPWLIVRDWPPTVVASNEVLIRISLPFDVKARLFAKVMAPVQLCAPLVLMFAPIVVGPVTVKLLISEVPPIIPLNITLPSAALPVVAVKL